uniref:Uncharacterized protein n=1 Tax=Magnetococcus massalia (strain MO-1) TaxID=451514 RepID=A0A1S7LF13_MAGMO|nr:conserved membrane protein of unknown function [Candidatus Magnetococcus massalia]
MFLNSGLHIDQAPPLSIPFRFFATAPLFMIIVGGLLLLEGETLLDGHLSGEGIAITHGVMLGWLAMVMWGALYQMIPVVGGIRVRALALAPWSHGTLTAGTLLFILAMLDWLPLREPLLWLAGGLLLIATALFIPPILHALLTAPAKHPTIRAMALAVSALVITLLLGLHFVVEHILGFSEMDRLAMLGIHMGWALIGWVAMLIVGVSFQVVPMFYMADEFPRRWAAVISILVIITPALLSMVLTQEEPGSLPLIALAPLYLAAILYGLQMVPLLFGRKRKIRDATLYFWMLGFLSAVAALVLLPIWFFSDVESLALLMVALFSAGFAGSIILGMLYKIIPFLVWFHRFSSLAGLVPTPTMEELVPDRYGLHHAWVQGGFLLCMTTALLTGSTLFWWGAGLLLILSGALLLYALWHALKQPIPEAPAQMDFEAMMAGLTPPASNTDEAP